MGFLKAFILGLVQGFTEFLPISSSGHLVLTSHFLRLGKQSGDIAFEIFLHLGSLIAVCIYFRSEIYSLLQSAIMYKNPERKSERLVLLWILLATAVTGTIGLVLGDFIESKCSQPIVVAIMLSITGIILFYSDKITIKDIKTHQLGVKKSLLIGLGQAVAIMPGISRSGTTITCAIMTGLDRASAARFSFLLSIPIILGANVTKLKTFLALDFSQFIIYMIGLIAAFISGIFAIKWLMVLITRAQLRYFSYYCWTISGISIILLIFGI
jgi:undecaprenyl-diphosphatase